MFLVPFHKGNGTGGTYGTRLDNDFQGLHPIERTLGHTLVPLVPLVSHIPRNGTEQDAGIKADFVPLLYRFVSAVSGAIQAIRAIHQTKQDHLYRWTCSFLPVSKPMNVSLFGFLLGPGISQNNYYNTNDKDKGRERPYLFG